MEWTITMLLHARVRSRYYDKTNVVFSLSDHNKHTATHVSNVVFLKSVLSVTRTFIRLNFIQWSFELLNKSF